MRKITLLLVSFLVSGLITAQNLVHNFEFNNNLNDTQASGNSLTEYNTATSSFGTSPNQWNWTQPASPGGGLELLTDQLTDPGSFSVGFRISFAETGPIYKKILSFRGPSDDKGFYFYNNGLFFYNLPNGQISNITLNANTFYDFIITRNSSNNVIVYVGEANGTLTEVLDTTDTSDISIPREVSGNREFRFFMNDDVGTDHTSGGSVQLIRVWDGPLSPGDIATALDPIAPPTPCTDASVIASDDAENYSGGWNNGSDEGNGFGNWSLSTAGSGNAGHYIGVTGQGTTSFGMFADAFNDSFAFRPLGRDLLTDETISVDIGATSVTGGAELLIELVNNGSVAFTVKFVGGQTNWLLNDGGSDFSSGEGFQTNTSINFSFTYEGGNNYSWSLGSNSGNGTATNNVNGIDEIRFINQGQGSGDNFGFNNLEIASKYTIPNGQTCHVTSNTTLPYLEVQNGGAVVVDAGNVLTISGNITNDGSITFKSAATGTAQFDTFTGTLSGTGDFTVERYIPANRAFRLLSSPVTTTDFILENWQQNGLNPLDQGYEANVGIQITGGGNPFNPSLGFDESGTNNPSMFIFDNTNDDGDGDQNNDWQELPNTNATKLNAGEPYLTMVRGDRSTNLFDASLAMPSVTTLKATGDLQTGSLTYDAAGIGANYLKLSNENNFYSLVANPYQAVVDYSETTRSGLTDFIYIWDAKIAGDNGRGGYVTVTVTTGAPSPSSSDASEFIAPGMSFFVKNDNDITTTSQITFEEADKDTGQNQVDVFNTYPHFYINSRLYTAAGLQNGDTENDAIGLRFSSNYTTPGNNNEDASKLFNPGENYAVINNGLRSLDYQNIPQIGHEIDLSITNYQETNYSLTFVMENKPVGLGVFIKDNYLSTQTELTDSFVYDFTVDANIPESVAENRFSLVFDTTTLGIDENSFGTNFRLYPNPAPNGQYSISTPNLSGEVRVEMTNLLGQQIYSKTLTATGNQVDVNAPNLTQGVYVVKLTQDNQSFSTKLIVD